MGPGANCPFAVGIFSGGHCAEERPSPPKTFQMPAWPRRSGGGRLVSVVAFLDLVNFEYQV
jgi:hypothetical protein